MYSKPLPGRLVSLTRILTLSWALLAGPALAPAAAQNNVTEELALGNIEGRERTRRAYPFAYYTPETEFAFGAGGIVTFYTSQTELDLRPSKSTVSGYYSTRGQFSFSESTEVYFNENRLKIAVPLSFGSLVDKYWGIGNQAPEVTNDEYDVVLIEGSVTVEMESGMPGFARDGFLYRASYRDIKDRKENPNLTEETIGVDGGFSSGFGFDFVADSRDHIFWPDGGGFSELNFVWYAPLFGSDFRFSELDFDLRRYVSAGSNSVVAFQVKLDMVFGEVPFYEMPGIGGSNIMRGYYTGRYRDRTALAGQLEYRKLLFWRVGAVAFAGLGDVFGSDYGDTNFSDLKYSLGGGLRFLFNKAQKINLRMDIGFGRGSSGLYFGLEEAF